MTLAELIATTERLRPSQYDKDQLTMWVNEIEAQAVDQIFNKAFGDTHVFEPYNYEVDAEKELLIPDENADIYMHYLAAKVDYWNGEIERYNNSVAMYQTAWNNFASKYRRNHLPKWQEIPKPCDLWPDVLT